MPDSTDRAVLEARQQTLAAVQALLVATLHLEVDPTTIEPNTPLFGAGLELDSIDAVELVVALESAFGLELQDEQIEGVRHLRTVDSLVDRVLRRDSPAASTEASVPFQDPPDPGYEALRTRVALSRPADLVALRLDGATGWTALDRTLPCGVRLPSGRLRPTLLLDEGGRPRADVLLGNLRGDPLLLVRGMSEDEVVALLGPTAVAEHLHRTHAVFAADGPFAWELMSAWNEPGIIGLPYLGVFTPEPGTVVLRAGATGEYGYTVLVLRAEEAATEHALARCGEPLGANWVDAPVLRRGAIESNSFTMGTVGRAGLDALELQLGWRIDLQRDQTGLAALRAHRAGGLRRRLTAFAAGTGVAPGDRIRQGGEAIGAVLVTTPGGGGTWGQAVLDLPWAQSGVDGCAVGDRSVPLRTVSAPFVLSRSLFVNPQKHDFAHRHDIPLPRGLTWGPVDPR